jgi:hypothetical protein
VNEHKSEGEGKGTRLPGEKRRPFYIKFSLKESEAQFGSQIKR